MTEKLPHSYHTFLCPFIYEEENKDIGNLVKNKYNKYWEYEASFKRESGPLIKSNDGDIGEEDLLRYAEYHYFMPAAQELLFNIDEKETKRGKKEDNSILFEHKHVKSEQPSQMSITISGREYKLRIDSIRLSIYPQMHIGVLSIELENYLYDSIDDIIKINEFGRRVFSPAIQRNEKNNSKFDGLPLMVPSKIEIILSDKKTIEKQNENRAPEDFGRTQELIEKILYGEQAAKEIEESLKINPAIDDRMFVVSLVRKDDYKPIQKRLDNKTYCYMDQGSDAAKDLYRLIFLESGLSCQNTVMLQDKLKEHVYPRWTDYGTVHGVTEYSMVCLTSEDEDRKNDTINPFLTTYVDMVKLALVQRTAIINLEHKASKISEEIKISDEDDNLNDLVKNSQELWKKYIKFQNEFYMPEVTFQEQGVEIYDILKKSLRLEELNRYLEDELNDFHALTEMQDSNRREEAINQREVLNTAINLIAVVGTTVAIVSMAQDYINDLLGNFNILTFGVGFFVVLLINIFTIFVLNTFREKRKGKMWGILCVVWMLLLIIVYFMMEPSIKWSKSSVSANNCEYVSEQE